MKKNLICLAAITGLCLGNLGPVYAQDNINNNTVTESGQAVSENVLTDETVAEQVLSDETEPSESRFTEIKGYISELTPLGKNMSLLVKKSGETTEEDSRIIFNLSVDTPILDYKTGQVIQFEDLNLNQSITVIVPSNAPMALSMPPRMNAYAVIVDSDKDLSVKVERFDESFLSYAGDLQLNISKDTAIINLENKTLTSEEIVGKNVAVFYGATTRSLPPQTTPSRIVVLPDLPSDLEQTEEEAIVPEVPKLPTAKEIIEGLGENDVNVLTGNKFVPLAYIAKALGYEAEWIEETKSVHLIRNGETEYSLTIGKTEYIHKDGARTFEVAPVIIDSRTYVEVSFFDDFGL